VRPLRSWPMWKLRLALMSPFHRHRWGQAYIEVHYREVVEPTLAATNNETGPWLVSPPRGMH
jgi:hypothetical protein